LVVTWNVIKLKLFIKFTHKLKIYTETTKRKNIKPLFLAQ